MSSVAYVATDVDGDKMLHGKGTRELDWFFDWKIQIFDAKSADSWAKFLKRFKYHREWNY